MAREVGENSMSETLTLTHDSTLSLLDDDAKPFRTQPASRRRPQSTATIVGTSGRERSFQECLRSIEEFRNLPINWDRYGGKPIHPLASRFAINLLEELLLIPEVSSPNVRPISEGVFIEWRSPAARLYFEVDDESVLQYLRNAYGEDSREDPEFNVEDAVALVRRFHHNEA